MTVPFSARAARGKCFGVLFPFRARSARKLCWGLFPFRALSARKTFGGSFPFPRAQRAGKFGCLFPFRARSARKIFGVFPFPDLLCKNRGGALCRNRRRSVAPPHFCWRPKSQGLLLLGQESGRSPPEKVKRSVAPPPHFRVCLKRTPTPQLER